MTTANTAKRDVRVWNDALDVSAKAQALMLQSGWTQGCLARDVDDRGVDPSSDDAVKFCAIGAIMRIIDDADRLGDDSRKADHTATYLVEMLDDVASRDDSSVSTISEYNDSEGRDFSDVENIFFEADDRMMEIVDELDDEIAYADQYSESE